MSHHCRVAIESIIFPHALSRFSNDSASDSTEY